MSDIDPERPYRHVSEADIIRMIDGCEENYREWRRRYRKAEKVRATDDMDGQLLNMQAERRVIGACKVELEVRRREDRLQNVQDAPMSAGIRHGVIKRWNPDKGFGFIAVEGEPDTFVHFSALQLAGVNVVFNTGQGKKGPEARDVSPTIH